jgi:crossover junction endodeoxyribonuclease RuvC
MRALGVDPGTLHLGWGVVVRDANRLQHIAHGVIHLDPKAPLAERLLGIAEGLAEVIRVHQPEVGSVETLFFHKDPQAAAKLGHARGVVLLSLQRAGVAVAEYAPARVKRTIVGSGRAEKPQVAAMVRALLALNAVPAHDAADALALAITHLRIGPMAERLAAAPSRAAGRRSPLPQIIAALKARRAAR